jgi:hypothetical protein
MKKVTVNSHSSQTPAPVEPKCMLHAHSHVCAACRAETTSLRFAQMVTDRQTAWKASYGGFRNINRAASDDNFTG